MIRQRLQTIADMITEGHSIADIGTDHGFLPIELVRSGKVPYAIAMDIVEGPLARAKEHIEQSGLNDKIECRLSDGFDKLEKGEVHTAVIAGMGGDLISDIIQRKPDVVDELVLSPHTHHEKVRKTLRDNNFIIVEERMIVEMNKYYVFIRAVRDSSTDVSSVNDSSLKDISVNDIKLQMQDYFGPLLINDHDDTLQQYLLKEIEKFKGIDQKQQYIQIVEMALDAMR